MSAAKPDELDRELAEFFAWLATQKLPPERSKRRCLKCWHWNPPMTRRCLKCAGKIQPHPDERGGNRGH